MTDNNNNTNLDNDFFKDRVLFMHGVFDEVPCQKLMKEFLKLIHEDSKKDIILYIDSYGGSVHSFLQLYNIIKSFKGKVHMIVTGKAMSAGSYLLMSGTKGYRFAFPHSSIMLHELAYGVCYRKLHDQKNNYIECQRLQKLLDGIVVKHTKIKAKDVRDILKEDTYLTPEEALKLGVIDKIIK